MNALRRIYWRWRFRRILLRGFKKEVLPHLKRETEIWDRFAARVRPVTGGKIAAIRIRG